MNAGSACHYRASCISKKLQDRTNGSCNCVFFAPEPLGLKAIGVGDPLDPVCIQQLHHIVVEKLICICECKWRAEASMEGILYLPSQGTLLIKAMSCSSPLMPVQRIARCTACPECAIPIPFCAAATAAPAPPARAIAKETNKLCHA